MEIYEQIEAKLMALEQLVVKLECEMKQLEALAEIVDILERKMERLRWREIG